MANNNFWYELQDMKQKLDRKCFEFKTINEKYLSYQKENKELRKENRQLKIDLAAANTKLQFGQALKSLSDGPSSPKLEAQLINEPLCQTIHRAPKNATELSPIEKEIVVKYDEEIGSHIFAMRESPAEEAWSKIQ